VAYGYWEQKGLTSALTDQGPYEFAVSGAGDDYIDLANTYPFVEAQIMDDDDTALDGGADVGSVNGLPTSGLFVAWQVLLELVVLGVLPCP
jgi:hypothetical protein